jgi:hypothetical protein
MAMTTCKECKQQISTEADACPHCGAKKQKFFSTGSCTGLGCLGLILAVLVFYWMGSANRNQTPSTVNPATQTPAPEMEQLELLAFKWGQSTEQHATAEGQVKNISGDSIKSVQAVVTWYDKSGTFVTSDHALIDYNPLLPGQTSPFDVIATFNPAMHTASVEFKHFAGGSIRTRKKEEPPAQPKPRRKKK